MNSSTTEHSVHWVSSVITVINLFNSLSRSGFNYTCLRRFNLFGISHWLTLRVSTSISGVLGNIPMSAAKSSSLRVKSMTFVTSIVLQIGCVSPRFHLQAVNFTAVQPTWFLRVRSNVKTFCLFARHTYLGSQDIQWRWPVNRCCNKCTLRRALSCVIISQLTRDCGLAKEDTLEK